MVKVNKLSVLMILVYFFQSGKSQNYIPIPLDSNHYWSHEYIAWQGFQGIIMHNSFYYSVKDTNINSKAYKIIAANPNCNSWVRKKGILRQDSASKKVFIYHPTLDTEYLLYNFDKHVGDTMITIDTPNYDFTSSPPTLITLTVSSVDSIMLLDSKYHKRIKYCQTTCYTVIEGMGGISSILEPYKVIFESDLRVICFGKKPIGNNLIYSYGNYGCLPDFTSVIENNATTKYYSLNNVVHDKLIVNYNSKCNIKLYDITGKELSNIFQESINGNHHIFDLSNLCKGIYLIYLYSNDKVIGHEKIIKD
ncbi:MAG: T9SS type A sorting domain-containing protein [Flavobacteriales bacterium]|nr:T9SS type A sorting domain-containing protein [Flavobacteriales bacterium]